MKVTLVYTRYVVALRPSVGDHNFIGDIGDSAMLCSFRDAGQHLGERSKVGSRYSQRRNRDVAEDSVRR
jgi:hypothetical protein